jgi:hypothetical protein
METQTKYGTKEMKYLTFQDVRKTLQQVGIKLERHIPGGGKNWIFSMTFPDGVSYDEHGSAYYIQDSNQETLCRLLEGGLGLVTGTWQSSKLVRGVEVPYVPVFTEEQQTLAMKLLVGRWNADETPQQAPREHPWSL